MISSVMFEINVFISYVGLASALWNILCVDSPITSEAGDEQSLYSLFVHSIQKPTQVQLNYI